MLKVQLAVETQFYQSNKCTWYCTMVGKGGIKYQVDFELILIYTTEAQIPQFDLNHKDKAKQLGNFRLYSHCLGRLASVPD